MRIEKYLGHNRTVNICDHQLAIGFNSLKTVIEDHHPKYTYYVYI